VHRGLRWWRPDIQDVENLAASMQSITEDYLVELLTVAKQLTRSEHLVLMGGVALNCVANSVIAKSCGFNNIWIMPNPGDAGSSLGAALAYRGKHMPWFSPYLGHDIQRDLDSHGIVAALADGAIVGIANGRAEFGPRALGNRSLLADPRGTGVKDKVNQIKQREPFRPFAPMIIAEMANDYFEMPVPQSPYMQFVAPCRFPEQFPAICHVDNSSRVQTVTRADNDPLYDLLKGWYDRTGCPMLLNTSLNIKGEPLVNTWDDAQRFKMAHHVPIY
jgi:carbamoyltransferase